MKTILITGAGGFLGSHVLQRVLDATDWHAICVDSFADNGATDRIEDAIRSSDDTAYDRVTVICHDLAAPFSARQVGRLAGVDYVVHAAARCSVDDSVADPRGHVLNNVAATLTVLELARGIHPERVLHVSTDEVFGPGAVAVESLDAHRPSSPYAASKAACEDVCAAYRATYELPVAILNSANLFGPRQSQLAFIPKLIRRATGGETVAIHASGGQPGWRWYTYAPNVAAWITKCLPVIGEYRYPLDGQLGIDNLKLARTVAELAGVELRYELVRGDESRPGWDPRYRRMLGDDKTWQPEVSAEEGLRRTVGWFLAHPEWLT